MSVIISCTSASRRSHSLNCLKERHQTIIDEKYQNFVASLADKWPYLAISTNQKLMIQAGNLSSLYCTSQCWYMYGLSVETFKMFILKVRIVVAIDSTRSSRSWTFAACSEIRARRIFFCARNVRGGSTSTTTCTATHTEYPRLSVPAALEEWTWLTRVLSDTSASQISRLREHNANKSIKFFLSCVWSSPPAEAPACTRRSCSCLGLRVRASLLKGRGSRKVNTCTWTENS